MIAARPASTPALTHSPTFERLFDLAFRGPHYTGGHTYALDPGDDEKALSGYADGAVSVYERSQTQEVMVRCTWAMKFDVNRVKNRRLVNRRVA